MTLPMAPFIPVCRFCGWSHREDYSDVRGTLREWIEPLCLMAKKDAAKTIHHLSSQLASATPPDPSVLRVKFKRIHGHAGAPTQAYRHDAGWDLEICEATTLVPGVWQNLRTGIIAAIPEGWWGHILARSSTWRKRGIRVEPAVIDASYRGELMAYAVNTGALPVEIKVGDRLAQIIVVRLPNVEWLEQAGLPDGERGDRGYGSSGQ